MSYPLSGLTVEKLKSIYDSAFIDCKISENGSYLTVSEDLQLIVEPKPEKALIDFSVYFFIRGDRLKILEFCNRFNQNLVIVRSYVGEETDDEGDWTILFEHQHVMFEQDSIEPKTLVQIGRRVSKIINAGIESQDTDNLFK